MLSCRAKYGLKAVLRIASDVRGRPVLAAEIARTERLPLKFLEQILLELTHRGLLQSRRGKGGGYALARPADLVSVGEIVRALDGTLAPLSCVSRSAYSKCCDGCIDETICGVHLVMKEVRDVMAGVLDTTTITAVLRMSGAPGARMATPQVVPPRARVAERPSPDAQVRRFPAVRDKPPLGATAARNPVTRKAGHVVDVVEPRARRNR